MEGEGKILKKFTKSQFFAILFTNIRYNCRKVTVMDDI